MSERCKPHQLHLVAAAPRGSIHFHETAHSLETVLEAGYFLNVRQNLLAGDTVRLARMCDGALVETADLIVTSGGQKFQHVNVRLRENTYQAFGEQKADPAPAPIALAKGVFTVKRGYQCFEVLNEKGGFVSRHGSKAEAESACAELMGEKVAA